MRGISKQFGSIRALRDVDLDIVSGRVHGLTGANGSGKSTLLNVLSGVVQPDAGGIYLDGLEVTRASPRHMRELKLFFIHQELNVVPKFSAVQNMMLGLPQPTRLGVIDMREARARVKEVAARLHIAFPLDIPVERLSVAERWLVCIGHALMTKARFIAMDESTASLSVDQCEQIYRIIGELAESGVAVVLVSHRLDEIMELSDTVTVLKDGRRVAEWSRGEFTKQDLMRAIVGGDVPDVFGLTGTGIREQIPVLAVCNLRRDPLLKDVSFELHAGEVLGLGGLVGSGRTNIVRMLFGAERPHGGIMLVDGEPYAPRTPLDALSKGVVLVPEERRSEGLILNKTITFNINMPTWSDVCLGRWLPIVNKKAARNRAEIAALDVSIQMKSVDELVRTLSGGNQQKVVIAKWLATHSRVLLLDEPTRGVDVGSRAEIYHIIRQQAQTGMAVLVICSELQELRICDRVLVIANGQVVSELEGHAINEKSILHAIYQAKPANGETVSYGGVQP